LIAEAGPDFTDGIAFADLSTITELFAVRLKKMPPGNISKAP
jgi:hypothetical protein